MNKIIESICLLLIIAGIVLTIGTAGASDMGVILIENAIIRMVIGLIMCVVGYIGLRLGGSEYVN